jgi:hypothetical protein
MRQLAVDTGKRRSQMTASLGRAYSPAQPSFEVLQDTERYAVLTEFFQFFATWAVNEAEQTSSDAALLARSPIHTSESATARLAAARGMCDHWAKRLAQWQKQWEWQDLQNSRSDCG